MKQAIGGVLAFGVVAALSPIPIIAVILMLTSARAKVNGPAFIAGWLVGLTAIGVIVLAIIGPSATNDAGEPDSGMGSLKLVLGLLLLFVALRQWRSRPRPGEEPVMPKWMSAADAFTPAKAAGAGVTLSALNPKNLILAVGAAATIAETGNSGAEQAIAYAVFVLIATIGVGACVVIYYALGARAPTVLDPLQTWMGRHNSVIMSVICLVIGAKLIGDGIAGV